MARKKSSKNKIDKATKSTNKIVLICVVIAIIFIVLLCIIIKKDNKKVDLNSSNSFFFKNEDNKYAIINNDGKQLTDFIYTSASTPEFLNGSALVKEDDITLVINEKGKTIFDSNKYNFISSLDNGLYEVISTKNNHFYIVNGKGKELYDLENVNIISTSTNEKILILEIEKDNLYKVIDYEGKEITSFKRDSKLEIEPSISTSTDKNVVSIFYNNKNYIINLKNKKVMSSFKEDIHYCIHDTNDDESIITLYSCTDNNSVKQDKIKYKFIKNNKLYDVPEECDSIQYDDYYSKNNVVCVKDNKKYLIDSKLNLSLEISSKYIEYIDESNYIEKNEYDKVDYYIDDELYKTEECQTIYSTGYASNNLYLITLLGTGTCKSENNSSYLYAFYNTKGENAFDKVFMSASKFDNNGNALVSEDGEHYYLINTKGEKVGEEYDAITYPNYPDEYEINNYYYVTKNDFKGLMYKDGTLASDIQYDDINSKSINYAILSVGDSKYDVYNLETKKVILELTSKPTLEKKYIEVKTEDKIEYYTYTGKNFYEQNNN